MDQWEQGIAALARRDWEEARRFLLDALEPGRDAGPEELEALGQAAWWLSDVTTAIAAREQAFHRFRERGDEQEAALVALDLVQDYELKMRSSIARAWMNRAQELVAAAPESKAAGYLARMQARVSFEGQGDTEGALGHADEAIGIARAVGDRDLEMLATHDKGQILTAMGRIDEGMPLMEKAMLAAAAGDITPMTVGRVYCNMIAACLDVADYGAASEWSEEAERWCEAASSETAYPGICRVRRSEINRRRGLLSAAEAGARRAIEELEHFVPFVAAAHTEIGNVHLQRGELERAEAEFAKAHEMGNPVMPGLALLRKAQGDPGSAASLLRAALAASPEAPLARAHLLPSAIELFIDDGKVEEAETLTDELEGVATRYGSSALRAATAYSRGLVAGAKGDSAQAALHLRRSFTDWVACGLPYDAARARFALGKQLAQTGSDQAAALEVGAAAAEFERLEAKLDLEETRRFLAAGESAPDPATEAVALLADLDVAVLSRYLVVGDYARFDDEVRNRLGDARQRIRAGLEQSTGNRENHLVWAAPGSGKTFFVQQLAEELDDIRYVELNLAGLAEDEFRAALANAVAGDGPCLILVDEVDAKPEAPWPYEVLLPNLDVNVERGARVVFVMAGSSGGSLDEMKQGIRSRPKGSDLLSRTPTDNDLVVAPLGVGDQLLVALSQLRRAALRSGRSVRAVEKAALFYIADTPYLANARQLSEFVAHAVRRMPPGEDRLKYDHLFSPGDPENKQFWMRLNKEAGNLVGRYVTID